MIAEHQAGADVSSGNANRASGVKYLRE